MWDGVNYFNAPLLEIVPVATFLRHNRGTMMHSLLVGAVFVAIVLAPCVIAMIRGVDESKNSR
jgi:hypothetical protein